MSNEEMNEQEEKALERLLSLEWSAAIYSLWFGLDYGSILTAFALYKAVESLGLKSYLLRKDPELWTEHYDEKDNIAGKFIYKNCDVLDASGNENDKFFLENISYHILGSDVLWDWNVVGDAAESYFALKDVQQGTRKVAYGTSLGTNPEIPVTERRAFASSLREMNGISSKSYNESFVMHHAFGIQSEIVLDPVFLCDKEIYRALSEDSAAKNVEQEDGFVFSYIKNGDRRKRSLLLRGYEILLEKYNHPLRNFIDINRYPESKKALGLTPAYHILVDDWLYYLIHSDFVITDDYYGVCFALIFRKNFVAMCSRDMADLSRFTTLLDLLGLTERLVYLDEDFKTKEYLFRKPIRYEIVGKRIEEMTESSLQWLKKALGLAVENTESEKEAAS